jgi:hypothetical protein
MRKIMDHLLALQRIQFAARAGAPALPVEVEKLRAEVPPPILAHYDRLTARGKKGVALARNGVCSECHLRITGANLSGWPRPVIFNSATTVAVTCVCQLSPPST